MQANTSIISKSKLLIYSNKKWINLKSVLVIEYDKIKDILSKIKDFYGKPNLIFSFLFQNKQLIFIYGSFDIDRRNTEKIINSFSSEFLNHTTDSTVIKELSGYSIYSLLFGGFKHITKDSFLYYEQFGNKYYCKPYKFSTLKINNSNLEELLEVFLKQRLILTLSSVLGLTFFHITLYFIESSKNDILESVKIIKQKLIETTNITGQLVSIHKRELKESPTKSMSGLNDLPLKLESMFKWLTNLRMPKAPNKLFSYPRINNLKSTNRGLTDFVNQKSKNLNNISINQIITNPMLKSLISKLESNNWKIIDNISTDKFDIIKLVNENLILIMALSDKLIDIEEYDFTSFCSKGFNLIFKSSGNETLYSQNRIID